MSKQMGIYRITNKANGKAYIGSSYNVSRRLNQHLATLRKGKHFNYHLQRAFNLYGEAAFSFDVVECVDMVENLVPREQAWIDSIEFDSLYNISRMAGSTRGFRASPEQKAKLSLAHMGHVHSDEHKAKISLSNKGRIVSSETRRKISEAQKGKIIPIEQRMKNSQTKKGKTHSPETKARMSLAHKGKVHSPEHNAKVALAQKGKIISIESRAKMSLAHKGKKRRPLSLETREKISRAQGGKAVRQIDPVTRETIAIFHSSVEAGRAIGLKTGGSIRTACQDNWRKAGGYYWRWVS